MPDHQTYENKLKEIESSIASLDKMRGVIPDSNIETIKNNLLKEKDQLLNHLSRSSILPENVTKIQGDRSISINGNSTGNIMITGNNNLFSGHMYVGKPEEDPEKALRIYRRVLINASQNLPLRGIDMEVSDPSSGGSKLNLSSIYVDLYTKTRIEKDTASQKKSQKDKPEFLRILQASAIHRHIVVLGDPGSGKSTFVNHLCVCLAAYGLEQNESWLKRIPGWPKEETSLIPVPVILRDFARQFSNKQNQPDPCLLWNFICSRLAAQKLTFVEKALNDAFENGQAIILLDGLDEVPYQSHRTFIRDTIMAFSNRYPACRMIVTCRVLSYQDPAWQLSDFPSFELAAFDNKMIDAFIHAWYLELSRLAVVKPEESDDLANRLKQAVRRPDLWHLASNPLLLTVMSLVHTHKQRLPEARSLLYEESVDILLWRWEQIKTGSSDESSYGLTQLLLDQGRSELDLKKVLWKLAFWAHEKGGGDKNNALSDIGELELQNALTKLHKDNSRDWAFSIIHKIKMRAGLLIEREQAVYTFPHRTFQEYLAGSYLSTLNDFACECTRLAEAGSLWREVILLAVGRLIYYSGDYEKPLALVGELCPESFKDTKLSWQKAWLAGDVIREIGMNRIEDSNLGKDMKRRVQKRLVQLLEYSALTPVERNKAGNVLAKIGDPRFLKDLWYLPDEPLLGFVEIPEGNFLMGSDPQKDSHADKIETPQHKLFLKQYYIARYPVTVAQFKAFVEDSGYKPGDLDCLEGIDNHPVVYVFWKDAVSYCKWLTEKLRTGSNIPKKLVSLINHEGRVVRLPTEAEWEKAARGDDGRIYPWGDDFDMNKANIDETGIDTTNVVGCFPEGKSPYGLLEMSGNAYDWTNTTWGKKSYKLEYKYPYDISDGRENTDFPTRSVVIRGGSFWYNKASVRCARRFRGNPVDGGGVRSFRVALAPVLL